MTETDQTTLSTPKRSRAIDRILNSRGAAPHASPSNSQSNDTSERADAFIESGGKPQMGFSLLLPSGEMHAFQFFNIDNLKYTPKPSSEFITFDHRGKIAVIRGHQISPIFFSIQRGTLVTVSIGKSDKHKGLIVSEIELTAINQIQG